MPLILYGPYPNFILIEIEPIIEFCRGRRIYYWQFKF